ncbi:MAG: 2-phosphosulfolactate phosphatase [Firmicutes bacterium]|nr:2-phosphosulfolactate phosphatase [Bacillota bacterium]
MIEVDVFTCASAVRPEEIAGKAAMVIDVVRASSVIVTALYNGCREVVPLLTVEETMEKSVEMGPANCLKGGERKAVKIEGFDLGNSPLEYTPEVVGGKTVLLTTSNGTRALYAARCARLLIVGGFVNASAAAVYLADSLSSGGEERSAAIVCAGANDRMSLDDYCCAGLMIEKLLNRFPGQVRLTDAGLAANELYRAYRGDLMKLIIKTEVYQAVKRLGLEEDLKYCLEEDRFDLVPYWNGGRLIK